METPSIDIKLVYDTMLSVGEVPPTEPLRIWLEIRELQLRAISNDIEFYPAQLPYLLEVMEKSN